MPESRRFLSKEALFRYCIVSVVRALEVQGHSRRAAVYLVVQSGAGGCEQSERSLSVRTIYRWLKAADAGGISTLEPLVRAPINGSNVLSAELLSFLRTEREEDESASIPELIARARAYGVVGEEVPVDRTTVWRAMQRMSLKTKRARRVPKDMRRFEYTERTQMLIADFTEFRAGPTRRRRLALYILDDATRYGLNVVVGTVGEDAEGFLKAIYDVLRQYGRFTILYVDRGPAFVKKALRQILASLNISLVLGTPRHPQGRGKIERFNRTAKSRLLNSLEGAPDISPDLRSLTNRLRHDLKRYNTMPHDGLGGGTPFERWHEGRPLRPIDDDELVRAFTLPVVRNVSRDHVVSVRSVKYEVPAGNAGKKVTLHHRLIEDTYYFLKDGELLRLSPLDKNANARAGRAPASPTEKGNEANKPPRPSASTLRYNQDHAPITDADGGFSEPKEDL